MPPSTDRLRPTEDNKFGADNTEAPSVYARVTACALAGEKIRPPYNYTKQHHLIPFEKPWASFHNIQTHQVGLLRGFRYCAPRHLPQAANERGTPWPDDLRLKTKESSIVHTVQHGFFKVGCRIGNSKRKLSSLFAWRPGGWKRHAVDTA
jgi:hypothetical protein